MGNTSIGMQAFSSTLRASTYKHSNRHNPPLKVKSDLGVRSLLCGVTFVWYNFHNENKTNIKKKRKVK